jgi:hypothetical protein
MSVTTHPLPTETLLAPFWLDIGTLLTAIFTAVAALAALLTIRENRIAVKATYRAVEAELLGDFLKDYSSEEMLNALLRLRDWKEKYKIEFAKKFEQLYRVRSPEALEITKARRTVLHFFQRILMLYNGEYVSKQFCETLFKLRYISLVFEVVEPLEEIVVRVDSKETYNREIFDQLREISCYKASPDVNLECKK